MVDITRIANQPLSSIVGTFYRCLSCNKVDNDRERIRVGYPCPSCGIPSQGARLYFPLEALSLIDLVQGFYHTRGQPSLRSPLYDPTTNPRLATAVFFCSLGEVLLTHLLREIMRSNKIPEPLQERLLTDNLFVRQRVEKLYPSLTHQRWTDDVKELSQGKQLNYLDIHKFFLKVTETRNQWLHQGNIWAIPPGMPDECLRNLWPLISMFVALHNKHATSTG